MSAVRDRALALLSRREHSRRELFQKLARHFAAAVIDAALDELAGCGLLCERRFALAYVRTAGKKFGVVKLRGQLKIRGVGEADIAHALAAELADDEETRAVAVLRGKFGGWPLTEIKQRARAGRFLQSRGFVGDTAAAAIGRHNRTAAIDKDGRGSEI